MKNSYLRCHYSRESNNGIVQEKPIQFLGLRFTETKIKLRNDEYNFIVDAYRAFHNSRPKAKEGTRDRIWMCNCEEKKSSLKDILEKTT
jgi:hypothetical protein